MQSDTLAQIVEYIWIPIVTSIVVLWRKLNGVETITKLIQQHDATELVRRQEERERHETERKETREQIESHHTTVMNKLDSLEVRIKNGH